MKESNYIFIHLFTYCYSCYSFVNTRDTYAKTEELLFYIIDQKYCNQCNGVGMGFSLGLTLANVFMCHLEKNLVRKFPISLQI